MASSAPSRRIVDDLATCRAVVDDLLAREVRVAVDLEGEELSRTGAVCLLQVATASHTYLFDICKLGAAGFAGRERPGYQCDSGSSCDNYTVRELEGGATLGGGRLKELLESRRVEKIFYDVRADCDALHAQFGVRVRNAFDVQILCAWTQQQRGDGYLWGLAKALKKYTLLPAAELQRIERLKQDGLRLFAPELGGRAAVWRERPLPELLVDYASCDVRHLLGMVDAWGKGGRSSEKCKAVAAETESRISRTLAARTPVRGRDRARRDFAPRDRSSRRAGVANRKATALRNVNFDNYDHEGYDEYYDDHGGLRDCIDWEDLVGPDGTYEDFLDLF